MGKRTRRVSVTFTEDLRQKVSALSEEMHALFRRGYTPKAKPTKACNACSLKELCLPTLLQKKNVSEYLNRAMEEIP